jgi:putative membrane protein
MDKMLQPLIKKNDKNAKIFIGVFSFVVFAAVALLGKLHFNIHINFDVHIFAAINAVLNSIIAVLLVLALVAVKNKKYLLHKNMMMTALMLSVLFLVSYIAHHLLAPPSYYGDANHDGQLSTDELALVTATRGIYFAILLSHIFLAAIILPFILFTAYRGLTAEFPLHKKIAKYTWPLWFYVALSGPVVYWMIHPYYR